MRGTTGAQLLEWARRADQAGFSSLGTIGAVSYPTYEELTVFAAAAAVTENIHLLPNVIITPARSTAELAKQAATVQALSGGRLTLGLGVGWQESDYTLTGRAFHERGRAFDQQLADLQRAFAGEALAAGERPTVPDSALNNAIPILIGGMTVATIRRVVEHGVGWTAGGLPPEMLAPFLERVRGAWRDAGREGQARIVALVYYSLGDAADSRAYLLDYYEAMGDMANMVAESALRSPEAIRSAIDEYASIGVDELILDPTVSEPSQVDLLADVAP